MTIDPILSNLNKNQYEAVINTDGPSLVFAGAGSGKTRVLTHRIAYILDQKKTTADRILAVTFTNKAASEMRDRLESLLGKQATWVNMGTFHSINARILRSEADKLGMTSNFTIYDSDDSMAVIREAMKQLNISKDTITPNTIRSFISRNKQQMIMPGSPEIQNTSEYLAKEKCDVYKRYQSIIKKSNAYDFDDLLIEPIRLFQEHPEVLKKYQYRWDYVLVDEYQDTNMVQFLFLELISARHKNICVVGDDDQSIYSWRGAEIKNILEFEDNFPNPTVIKLEQNYRSTSTILKAASVLVANNSYRHPKKIWTDNEAGEKIELNYSVNAFREGDFIAAKIQEQLYSGKKASDFAILYRTNAQSRAIEESLRNRMIKYVIIGGIRFYERKEIKDLLAYLRIFVNPSDATALQRIINVPGRKIGKVTIEKLKEFAEQTGRTLWEALQYPREAGLGAASKKIDDFLKLVLSIKDRMNELSPSDFVRELIDKIGFIRQYELSHADILDQERIANINEFINGISQFELHNEDATIEDYLQDVSLLTDIDQYNDKSSSVVLMTLHSAKGLEFPTVFITGMEDGLFPLERAKENEAELEEERRLFYVGITRAMKKVYLTSARQRMKYGYEQMQSPSPFIDELPADCLNINVAKKTAKPTHNFPGEKRFNIPTDGKRFTPTTVPTNIASPAYSPPLSSTSKPPVQVSKGPKVIKKGDWVNHKIFGKGKVLSIQQSSTKIFRISFSGGIVKSIAAKFVQAL